MQGNRSNKPKDNQDKQADNDRPDIFVRFVVLMPKACTKGL